MSKSHKRAWLSILFIGLFSAIALCLVYMLLLRKSPTSNVAIPIAIDTPEGGPVVNYNYEFYTDADGNVVDSFGYVLSGTVSGWEEPSTKLTERNTPIPNTWTNGSELLVSGNFKDMGNATITEINSDDNMYSEVSNLIGDIYKGYRFELYNESDIKCSSDSALTYMFHLSSDRCDTPIMYYVQPDGDLYACAGIIYDLDEDQYIVATLPYAEYVFIKNVEEVSEQ